MSNNHINQSGNLHMIDISEKSVTLRVATLLVALRLMIKHIHL